MKPRHVQNPTSQFNLYYFTLVDLGLINVMPHQHRLLPGVMLPGMLFKASLIFSIGSKGSSDPAKFIKNFQSENKINCFFYKY